MAFFGVQYLGKSILEKYLPRVFVQDILKKYLEDTKHVYLHYK